MRETRSYGSVRGAAGNSRPYREPGSNSDLWVHPVRRPFLPGKQTLAGVGGTSVQSQEETSHLFETKEAAN